MPNRTTRVKALEEKAAKRFEDKNCICHPSGVAQFHTNEECDEARKIPCPIHGFGRWKMVFVVYFASTSHWHPQTGISAIVHRCFDGRRSKKAVR